MTSIEMDTRRNGLLASGNFVVDRVKIVDHYPPEQILATVLEVQQSGGGGPYNVLKDLRAMQVDYPLAASGCVGGDADGQWIFDDCKAASLDTSQLCSLEGETTSTTDAMTVESTGRRTFFHCHGANARFSEEMVDVNASNARIFYLGYLTLLKKLDLVGDDGRTGASRMLEAARAVGMTTVVDMVSIPHPDFAPIVRAAAPHCDILIANELEAAMTMGLDPAGVGSDELVRPERLTEACDQLLSLGVPQAVVVHCEHGAVLKTEGGEILIQPSLAMPTDQIRGGTGAGDAFAAGLIHALHQGWPLEEGMRLAVTAAAACLTQPGASEGLRPVDDCLSLADRFGYRAWG